MNSADSSGQVQLSTAVTGKEAVKGRKGGQEGRRERRKEGGMERLL